MKPRLLDLFCGAGGCSVGYSRAGFDVVGVDIKPQPHYPFEFHQGDALEYLAAHGTEFDAIHASPPCQAYSTATRDKSKHPDLYDITRRRLTATDRPYVIENVIGAPYSSGIVLCGSMFGLAEAGEWIRRHRNFETSWLMFQPPCHHPEGRPILVTSKSFVKAVANFGDHSRQGPFDLASRMMGIDWMTRGELAQAIPPAYCEFIGKQLLSVLRAGEHRQSGSSPEHKSGTVASLGRKTDSPLSTDAPLGSGSCVCSSQPELPRNDESLRQSNTGQDARG